MRSKRTAVEEAAYLWWLLRRPVRWFEPEHVDNPGINCIGPTERALAEAVAAMVEAERYKDYRT